MTDAATANKGIRCPSMTLTEDQELCKAFIATSEDPIVGANMRDAGFKAKLNDNYNTLIKEHNRTHGTSHSKRNNVSSLHNRFKKLSRLVLKLIAIEDAMGEVPSGDNDAEIYCAKCREMFIKQNPDGASIVESIGGCKAILEEHPKWRSHADDEDDRKKKAAEKKKRPMGNKKAKQLAADKVLIEKVVKSETASKADTMATSIDLLATSVGQLSNCKCHTLSDLVATTKILDLVASTKTLTHLCSSHDDIEVAK